MRYIILFVGFFVFASCDNKSSYQPPSTPQPVEPVINDTPVVEPEPPKVYVVDDIIGKWNVTLKCTETSCDWVKVDDMKPETWLISKEGDLIKINVLDNKETASSYDGIFRGGSMRFQGTQFDGLRTGKSTIIASIEKDDVIEGTREVLVDEPCKIVYTVTAKKD